MSGSSLREQILAWDGKSSEHIKACYRSTDNLVDVLIPMLTEESTAVGASWLLKHHFENAGDMNDKQIRTVYQSLPHLVHWEAKLHVLQSMPYMRIPQSEKATVERFVRAHLCDPNKFVRAWSYNGFYELAVRFTEMQQEATQLFEMALRDEPASVKARVRNILKKGF